jgi:hypothetical protein
VGVGGRYIAKIEASHHDALTAYVAVDGHRSDDYDPMILATSDLGKSWRNITADLPKGWSVKCVHEDLRSPDVLYAGTENAIYASFDRGGRWIKLNGESLPTVAVDDIVQHPREFDLIVGTHGRSIYILDDASCFSQLTPERLAMPMAVFQIMPAKPRMYLPYEGAWGDGFFTASNPPMGATITYWLRDRQDDPVSIAITDDDDPQTHRLQSTRPLTRDVGSAARGVRPVRRPVARGRAAVRSRRRIQRHDHLRQTQAGVGQGDGVGVWRAAVIGWLAPSASDTMRGSSGR